MRSVPPEQWEQHYSDGVTFSPLGEDERALLAELARPDERGVRVGEDGGFGLGT